MEFREHSKLPNQKFATKQFHSFARIGGPGQGCSDTITDPEGKEFASAKSFSTLPKGNTALNIGAVSHRYFCSFYGDKALVALSDGGLGGTSSVEAAERALVGFVEYMHGIQNSIETTREAAHALQRSFARAHKYISDGKNDSTTCGSSQLLGGLLVKLRVGSEHPWAFVCCSVGHCKAFCLKSDKSIVDITQNNYLYRVSTPLGRLGPCVEGTYPDLTNLRLYYYPCDIGDTILVTTSGIHANFHPQQIGKNPSHLGLQIGEWKEIASTEKGKEVLNEVICKNLQNVLIPGGTMPSLHELLSNLGNYIMKTTSSARSSLEEKDLTLDKLNADAYPAILDNCSAFALKVMQLESMKHGEREDILKTQVVQSNRQWMWHTFIPDKDDSDIFDIFNFLTKTNPAMQETIDNIPEESFEECFINLNDGDIELKQEKPLVIQVRVRSKASQGSCIEKWEYAGEINMETNKPKNKSVLGDAFSNLLRQKEVDRRKISEAVEALLNLNTSKDVFLIQGKRKKISLEQFGSAFKVISGDMAISQASISITSVSGESKGKYRFIEISSKKESSISNFISNFTSKDNWITCAVPELILDESSQ